MINRKKLSRKLILVWLSACVVTASGCRLSPVLEQVVYEQNHNIDQDQESKDDQEDNQDEDQQMESKKQVDDSESQQGQEKADAVSGDGNAQSDTVYNGSYQDGAETNGTDNTSPENQTEAGGGAGTGTGTDNGGNGSQNGENGNGTGYEPGTTGDKSILDARGVTVKLPENVASVTAPGELGLMVEMLGGADRLLASSNSLTENNLAKQAFSGQGISNVKNWWSGTGTGQISDADFQELLNSKPDVCLELSGSGSFTSEQVTQLENAGITYAVMPKLDSVENIKKAVTLIGTVLGDKSSDGGTNAPALAKQYCDWADKVVSLAKVTNSDKQKYSLYISAWDNSASWTMSGDAGISDSGSGVAISANTDSVAALNDCLNTVLINNTQSSTQDQYINPLRNGQVLQHVNGSMAAYDAPGTYTRTADLAHYLGEEQFPAIIVANSTIKTNILNDKHWKFYGKNPSGTGTRDYGYTDANGKFVPSNIHNNYEIYVNPSGIGNWTTGSVETPLEAAWVSCKLQGQCTLQQVKDLVSEFYQTFYHLDVNTANILGE